MNNMVLISVVVSPAIEAMVANWLLEKREVSSFTSFVVNGRGMSAHPGPAGSQAGGMKKQVMFQLYLPEDDLAAVVVDLKSDFSGTGLQVQYRPFGTQLREAS